MNKIYSLKGKKIWVSGHTGMVGSALIRKLDRTNYNVLTIERKKLDLRIQSDVDSWINKNSPEIIFHIAGKVGGILENSNKPADFISENLQIQNNVINSAFKCGVKRLIFLGSACIYPISDKPIKENDLLQGKLEPTNRSYSIAKIAGIEMCRAFSQQFGVNYTSVQPNNLYGPNDNFTDDSAHVISSLFRKLEFAKKKNLENCSIWGTGKPKREFLFVDDLVDALIIISEYYNSIEPINVGSGEEIRIKDLAYLIKEIVKYKGKLIFDNSYPDGVKRKFLDSSKITQLGWKAKINLEQGLKRTYNWYKKNSS
mgnify:FL=1|tara:strand:+ start:849 stop:1787 length:939 start_codon:yes stop_codon:yes gene_type:complete